MEADQVMPTRGMAAVPFKMSPVDIIIPFHGEYDKVSRLMESIFNTVRTNRYQIILVDDASRNKTFISSFKKVPGVKAIQHKTQKGFGACVNAALADTRRPQPHVLVVQSDVVVQGTSWLFNLGNSLLQLRDKGVKMVSPMTDNPMDGHPLLKSLNHDFKADAVLTEGFLPMHCVMCHRELFKRVGGLKEYGYAGGEAAEFAARMGKHGYKQGVCGNSWVHHEGRGTLRLFDRDEKAQEVLRKAREEAEADIKALKN